MLQTDRIKNRKLNLNRNYFSSASYLITKNAAIKILNKIPKLNGMYDFSKVYNPLADHFLYENMKVYSMPLFNTFGDNSIIDNTDSTHKSLKDRLIFQSKSNNFIRNLWITNYKNMYKNIEQPKSNHLFN